MLNVSSTNKSPTLSILEVKFILGICPSSISNVKTTIVLSNSPFNTVCSMSCTALSSIVGVAT